MKSYMTFAIVAAVAVMLVASAAVATEDAFADKKEKKEYNQATSQANACGNGFILPLNVFCSNSASQIQGDENGVSTSSSQASD
jgi:Mn2+/Fe2+ NRAMP family transporter